jgi:hypothetical protein
MLYQGAGGFTQVPWDHGAAELYAFKAAVYNKVLSKHLKHEVEAALGHYFAKDNSRDYWIAGEMSLAIERILRDAVGGVGNAI